MKNGLYLFLILIFILLLNLRCTKKEAPLNIATFNLRYGTAADSTNNWDNRKSILIDCIREMQPGILGSQEGLPFQLEIIKDAFPNLKYFGLGRYYQVEVDRPHENLAGEHCAIFYDTTQFILDRYSTFWLSDQPNQPGSMSWGNTLPRIVTWGVFRCRLSQRSFAVFNTHFHWGEPFVSQSIDLIFKKIFEIAPNLPVVLLGDFNLKIDSEGYQTLTTRTKGEANEPYFADVWKALNRPEENAGTFHRFKGQPLDRIDFIFISSEFKVIDVKKITYEKAGKYPSDHFPVFTRIQFK